MFTPFCCLTLRKQKKFNSLLYSQTPAQNVPWSFMLASPPNKQWPFLNCPLLDTWVLEALRSDSYTNHIPLFHYFHQKNCKFLSDFSPQINPSRLRKTGLISLYSAPTYMAPTEYCNATEFWICRNSKVNPSPNST